MRYDRVKMDAVRFRIATLGLSSSGTGRDLIDRLDAYYRARSTQGQTIFQCDNCGFHSTNDVDDCPFCGEDDNRPFVDLDGGVQKKKVYFEEDLDEEIVRLSRLFDRTVAFWKASKILQHINRHQLWQLRRDRTRRKYRTFRAWARSETPFDNKSVRRMLRLADSCPNERSFLALIAPVIMGLMRPEAVQSIVGNRPRPEPPTENPVVRQDPEEGWCVEIENPAPVDGLVHMELEQEDGTVEIVPTKKELNHVPRRKFRLPPRKSRKSARISLDIGHARFPMKKRTRPAEQARKLEDDPWAEIPLSGTITMEVKIVRGVNGALELACETVRQRV